MRLRRPLYPLLVLWCIVLALCPTLVAPPMASAATLLFAVTTTTDAPDAHPADGLCATRAGQCSLRAAVQEADAQPRGSSTTVVLPAGSYALSLGALVISNTVVISGAGSGTTQLVGHNDRVLAVAAGTRAQVFDVTLTGGTAAAGRGGGVVNLGVLVLRRSTVSGNHAQGGGGVYNGPAAWLGLIASTLSGNVVTGTGGGVLNDGGTVTLSNAAVLSNTASHGNGSGLFSSGTLTVTNSTLSDNSASSGSGGGIDNQGALTVSGSTLSDNSATSGGGIDNGGTLTVTNSTVTGNTASNGGGISNQRSGQLWLISSIFNNNSAQDKNINPVGNGGAVDNAGTVSITNSTFDGNSARANGGSIDNTGRMSITTSTIGHTLRTDSLSGGGIYNSGILSINKSVLSSNGSDGAGGGIANSNLLTVTNSTISNNTLASLDVGSGSGAGIYNSGTLVVINSTLNGNVSEGDGGGITNHSPGTLSMLNSTLSGNTAQLGPGGISNTGTARISNSTLSGNGGFLVDNIGNAGTVAITGTIVAMGMSGTNCGGPLTEVQGFNLDDGTSCGFSQTTDLTGTNPLLGSLANNGGPTQTMALLPGSLAIDHGGTAANGCPATDQRGVTRPHGPACDIGAFELAP
jgi:CSLREA domain-containing protein